jgi:hypothetical protein
LDITSFDNESDLDEKTCIKLGKHLKDPRRTLETAKVEKASTSVNGVNKWLFA